MSDAKRKPGKPGRPRIHRTPPSVRSLRIPAEIDDWYCRRSLATGRSIHSLMLEAIKDRAGLG